jgi:EmrB/QacA subfamily drug resistance transporter
MITVITILLGVFCSAMEALVTATIMPTIISELGGFELYPWVANSFMLASVVTAPFAGSFADSFGYKKTYLVSVGIFIIGSLLCGTATSMQQLIAYRVVQGVGSSGLLTLSLVLFGALYPIEKRAKMQALVGAMWALASVLGPALGAFLTSHFSWPWAFWVNIPFGFLIFLAFIFRTVIPEPERKNFAMDLSGGALFTVGTLGIVYGLLNLGKLNMDAINWLVLLFGLFVMLYFVAFRKKVQHPFIPFYLFRKTSISLPVILAFFAGFFLFNVSNFTPMFVQGVLGEAAIVAGKVVTAVAFGSFTGSLISGTLLNRLGFRWMSTKGSILVVLGFYVLFLQGTHTSVWLLMLGNYIVGCGVSIIANANMVAVQAAAPAENLGAATSMVTFSRTFGGMIGIAMMGGLQLGLYQVAVDEIKTYDMTSLAAASHKIFDPVLRSTITPEHLKGIVEAFSKSLHAVFLGCGIIATLALLFAFRMPNRTPKEVSESQV